MSCYDALGIGYSIYQPVTALHSQQQEQQEQQQEQQLNMTVEQHLPPKVKTVMQQTTSLLELMDGFMKMLSVMDATIMDITKATVPRPLTQGNLHRHT